MLRISEASLAGTDCILGWGRISETLPLPVRHFYPTPYGPCLGSCDTFMAESWIQQTLLELVPFWQLYPPRPFKANWKTFLLCWRLESIGSVAQISHWGYVSERIACMDCLYQKLLEFCWRTFGEMACAHQCLHSYLFIKTIVSRSRPLAYYMLRKMPLVCRARLNRVILYNLWKAYEEEEEKQASLGREFHEVGGNHRESLICHSHQLYLGGALLMQKALHRSIFSKAGQTYAKGKYYFKYPSPMLFRVLKIMVTTGILNRAWKPVGSQNSSPSTRVVWAWKLV